MTPAAPTETDEERAAREAAEHAALQQERERRAARLVELAGEADAAVGDESLPSARKRFNTVRREWSDVALGVEVDPELLARYNEATTRMTARDAEAREADARGRREALARLHNLLGRVEPLAARPDLTLKAADRALRDVKTAFGSMPPLPTKQDFEEVMGRLKEVQAALTPKLHELREADDWRRFANVAIQEQLCAQDGDAANLGRSRCGGTRGAGAAGTVARGCRSAARTGRRAVAPLQDRARRGLGEMRSAFRVAGDRAGREPGEEDGALRAGRGPGGFHRLDQDRRKR